MPEIYRGTQYAGNEKNLRRSLLHIKLRRLHRARSEPGAKEGGKYIDLDMDFRLMGGKIVRRLRMVGVRAALREAFELLGRDATTNPFDQKYGTDTGGSIRLWKLKIESPNAIFGTKYEATDEETLSDAISFLREDLQNLTFMDLGCGKGRALIVAANLGFQQVIGVEFADELADIARGNLAKLRIANAVVVQTDAVEYRFPDTDMVVYLCNPFSQEVMEKVVVNLSKSLSKKLYVIYKSPDCAAIFDKSGFLTRLGCPPARPHVEIWRRAT